MMTLGLSPPIMMMMLMMAAMKTVVPRNRYFPARPSRMHTCRWRTSILSWDGGGSGGTAGGAGPRQERERAKAKEKRRERHQV
jgi:hypothetical protein